MDDPKQNFLAKDTLPAQSENSHKLKFQPVFDEQLKNLYDLEIQKERKYKTKAQFLEQHKKWCSEHMLNDNQRGDRELQISLLPLSRNLEVLSVYITYRFYKMTLVILNVEEQSKNHFPHFLQGNHAKVYVGKDKNQEYAVKCCEIKQNFQVKFIQAIKQYFFFKIAQYFKVGPFMKKLSAFDLIIYKDCIEFTMEFCDTSFTQPNNIMKETKNNLQILHLLKIVHSDIKPSNIGFSGHFEKYIFLDYGFTSTLEQEIGYKSSINFRGTLQYCSNQMKNCYLSKSKYLVDLYYNDIVSLKASLTQIQTKKSQLFHEIIQEQAFNFEQCLKKNNYRHRFQKMKEIQDKNLMFRVKYLIATAHVNHKHFTCFRGKAQFLLFYENISWEIFSEIIEFVDQVNYCYTIHHDINGLNSSFIQSNTYRLEESKLTYKMRSKSFILQRQLEKKEKSAFQQRFKQIFSFQQAEYSDIDNSLKSNQLLFENNSYEQFTAFLVIFSKAIAFQNLNYSHKEKLLLCSLFAAKNNLKYQASQLYKGCINYSFDHCNRANLCEEKLQILYQIYCSVVILQTKSDDQILLLLQKILKSKLKKQIKLKILLKHIQSLLWIAQKYKTSYNYCKFWSKTQNLIAKFCQQWVCLSQWQLRIKLILLHFNKLVDGKHHMTTYIHFYNCERCWKQAGSASIYELITEYILLIFGFEMQTSCIMNQQRQDVFTYYQQLFLHKISLKKYQYKLEYYYLPIAKYYSTFVYEQKYAYRVLQKLKDISKIDENLYFKILAQKEITLILEQKEAYSQSLSFNRFYQEQNVQAASNANKLWLLYLFTKLRKKIKENNQHIPLFQNLQAKAFDLFKDFMKNQLYLTIISNKNNQILPHSLQQNFSMIVWVIIYFRQIITPFQGIELNSFYQQFLALIVQHFCLKCKYHCIMVNYIFKMLKSNLNPLQEVHSGGTMLQHLIKKYKWSKLIITNQKLEEYRYCSQKYPSLSIQQAIACESVKSSLSNALNDRYYRNILDDLHFKTIPTFIYQSAANSFHEFQFQQYILLMLKALDVKTNEEVNLQQVKSAHQHIQNIIKYLSYYNNTSYQQIYQIHKEHQLFQQIKLHSICDYVFAFMILYHKTQKEFIDHNSVINIVLVSVNFLQTYTKQQTLCMHYLKILLSEQLTKKKFLKQRHYQLIYRKFLKLDPSPLITKFNEAQRLFLKMGSVLIKKKKEKKHQPAKFRQLLLAKIKRIKIIKQIK